MQSLFAQVRVIVERLARRLDYETIASNMPEGDRKLLTHIRKEQQRKQRIRGQSQAEDSQVRDRCGVLTASTYLCATPQSDGRVAEQPVVITRARTAGYVNPVTKPYLAVCTSGSLEPLLSALMTPQGLLCYR